MAIIKNHSSRDVVKAEALGFINYSLDVGATASNPRNNKKIEGASRNTQAPTYSLSDNRNFIPQKLGRPLMPIYHEKDVKDAVKELLEVKNKHTPNQFYRSFEEIIKSIFGEELGEVSK